ncbi:MAG: DUF547 domain-containing protein, partial [Pseudomonadota bacterium]
MAALTALLLTACTSIERAALPAPEPLGADWLAFAEPPGDQVDHGAWDAFLAKYHTVGADGIARLTYARVTPDDRTLLARYIATLARVTPSDLSRATALAYWINLYNALTVSLVLEAYPVDSIREITDGPLSIGPWSRPLVTMNGVPLSLNDIEHRIVRPAFNEPRIHYALNCAALGCPNLKSTSWRGASLDADLTRAEEAYLSDPRGISIAPDGSLLASKIFAWFREDFGPNEAAVLQYIRDNAPPSSSSALVGRNRISRYQYDWDLNDGS